MPRQGRRRTRRKSQTFGAKDYASGDGMITKIWGPPAWHLLHTISFNYPVNPTPTQQRQYREFVESLQHTLPCKYCRQNLTKNLQQLPLTADRLASRDTFSRYIYELHEVVNRMLGKKSGLTYCEVRERYEHFRSRCTQNETDNRTFDTASIAAAIAPTKSQQKHKGCTEPLYGKKSKCVMKIVPQDAPDATFTVDAKCKKRRQGRRTMRRRPRQRRENS